MSICVDHECEDKEGGVTEGAVPREPFQPAARTSTQTTSQEEPLAG